ncbi:PAS domain-containing protein [Sulfidibacter corallicola]|uniref:histidine kinase n=1 Tax=Sulfidibacter corallicola TaxID=2818388 RepID=A0A8A4TNY8_SULCO|nr:ATP-binding protein [Sulfidibacter corallicola]QTD51147.1 PAS domain-containing protein [Sulfidibacter corallicola]
MTTTVPLRDTFSRVRYQKIPRHFTLAIVVVSLLPFVLHLFGVRFGTVDYPTDWASVYGSQGEFAEVRYRHSVIRHTLVEWSAFWVALFTVVFSAIHYALKRDVTVLIIGLALFCAGCLDAVHTLAANRLIGGLADPDILISFSWALGRLFNALVLLAGTTYLILAPPRSIRLKRKIAILFMIGFGLVTLGSLVLLNKSFFLPIQTGIFNVVPRPWDLVPLVFFFVAGIWAFPSFYRRFPNLFSYSLQVSVVPAIAVQLHMALGSRHPFDDHFVIAHLLKVVTYLVPFLGLCLDYVNTYRNLKYEVRQRGAKARLLQDIQRREEAERQIYAEKERLRITLASIGDGVIATDTEGDVQLINEVGARLTGWSIEEATGMPLEDVLTLLDAKTHQAHTLNFEDSGSERVLPVVLVSRDGTERMVAERTTPILGATGDILGFVLVIRDITTQERLRTQIVHSQKMESIGQLAAGVAHEINSPMQFIGDNNDFLFDAFNDYRSLTSAQRDILARLSAESKLPQEDRRSLDDLEDRLDITYLESEIPRAISQSREGIGRVTQLIRAMKEFSHPDRAQKVQSDLNQAIRSTITISRNEWKYVARVEERLDEEIGLVPCHISQVNQAVLNLIVNAAQAIAERVKRGEFANGVIRIATSRKKNGILIQVSDNGGGIPQDIRHRIFDPFFTTKEIGAGTGQGLAITHDIIVNKHQGRIDVSTRLDEGTTFTLFLPAPLPDVKVAK